MTQLPQEQLKCTKDTQGGVGIRSSSSQESYPQGDKKKGMTFFSFFFFFGIISRALSCKLYYRQTAEAFFLPPSSGLEHNLLTPFSSSLSHFLLCAGICRRCISLLFLYMPILCNLIFKQTQLCPSVLKGGTGTIDYLDHIRVRCIQHKA